MTSVGHGKFGKTKGHCNEKTKENIYISDIYTKLINVGSFNKALGHGKESRINNPRAYVYFGV